MNIVFPMAGRGSRFPSGENALPKPLISVNGLPMIRRVIESLNIFGEYTFIVQKAHREQYDLDTILNTAVRQVFPSEIMGTHGISKREGNAYTKPVTIVEVDGVTEGAACTALLAKEYINNDEELLLVNSDTMFGWSGHAPHTWEKINHVEHSNHFLSALKQTNPDGCIVTHKTTNPAWSFAKIDDTGRVIQTAEKELISDNGTVGIYYWKHGKDFVKYAEQMIQKNIRSKNEFYITPVYNEAIADKKYITIYNMNNTWCLGTPEELRESIYKLWGPGCN